MGLKRIRGGPGSAERLAWEQSRRELEQGPLLHTVTGVRRRRWFLFWLRPFILAGLRLTGLHAAGRRNALALAVSRIELCFSDLPEPFDGYRILHISDPHLETLPEMAEIAARVLHGEQVDLVALTGDFQRRGATDPALAASLVARILQGVKSRDGVVATLGNHDSHAVVPLLENLGIVVLANESAEIQRDGAVLSLCGTDDPAGFYTPAIAQSLRDARGEFKIALVHTPEIAQVAAAAGFSLYLSGHTHGGQVCLPGGRPVLTFLQTNLEYARGLWRCGTMIGYTTTGLGTARIPVRFACPPEVALITLRRAGSPA